MTYRLFYDDIDLGEVRHVDSDFPSSFGIWTPSQIEPTTDLRRHLLSYIEHSIVSMALLDASDAGPEWHEFAGREEPKYQDLIDSDQWKLVPSDGHPIRILIPLFRREGELTWRYQPEP